MVEQADGFAARDEEAEKKVKLTDDEILEKLNPDIDQEIGRASCRERG